jgi:hypothetical protein
VTGGSEWYSSPNPPTPQNSLPSRILAENACVALSSRCRPRIAGKLTTDRDVPKDLGLHVLKLDRSHYEAWRGFEGGDVTESQTSRDRFESPLGEG